MQYVMTPFTEPLPPFCVWENGFNNQELDTIQNLAFQSSSPGLVGGGLNVKDIRKSNISWLHNNNQTLWIFQRLSFIASSLNSQFYRFNLTGFGELLQLSNYDGEEQGKYSWHQDYCQGNRSIRRKLSIVLQLTDPCYYEGGNLQIMDGSSPVNVPKKRGLLVAFPSFILHQVTPVTSGSRQSLVAWISGEPFK